MAQWVKDQHCHCSNLGGCCGVGLYPGVGTSRCFGHGKKKKKKCDLPKMIFLDCFTNLFLMKEVEVSLGISKTFLHNSCVSMLFHDLYTALLKGIQEPNPVSLLVPHWI